MPFAKPCSYEDEGDDAEFEKLCKHVAVKVIMHPEVVAILRRVATSTHVGAVIVTCGPRRVWEEVLKMERLSDKIQVIGGGRIKDGFGVTPSVKAAMVASLQEDHKMYVWAFGDLSLIHI